MLTDTTEMIGISPDFLGFKNKLQQVAQSNVPILLTGETGSGKEMAAKFIHNHSAVASGQLITVDCTLLPEHLFESELFGHEKGAFTNAITARKGLFEIANNGTLFLDEVGELPLSQQPKLLRALESGQFRRVGSCKVINSKVRIVCATNKNLVEMVKEGSFRADLFYRLSVFTIEIVPLRDRLEDIPLLAEYLLRADGFLHQLTPAAISKLTGHLWPGNIRELKNCLQLAVALTSSNEIDVQHIQIMRRRTPPKTQDADNQLTPASSVEVRQYPAHLEKEVLAELIAKYQGNRKKIAAAMGISERTLYRKLSEHVFTVDS